MADAAKEVCRAFRNTQSCRYGDKCKFEHSSGDPIAQPPRKVGECHNFRDSGNCEFGEKCRFAHGSGDARIDSSGALQRNISDEVCRNYQRNLCRFGDQCRRRHEGAVEPQSADAAAGAPRRRRGVRNGSKSAGNGGAAPAAQGAGNAARPARAPRRRSTKTDSPAAAGADDDKSGRRRRPRTRGPPIPNDLIVDEQGREVCRTYYHRHKCRWADGCRFIHVAGPNPVPEQAAPQQRERAPRAAASEPRAPRPRAMCRTFAEGKCEFAELCRFQHGDSDARDPAEVAAKNRAARQARRSATQQ